MNSPGSASCVCKPGYTGDGTFCKGNLLISRFFSKLLSRVVTTALVVVVFEMKKVVEILMFETNLFSLDINECITGVLKCDENSFCVNSPGSASCVCKTGYTADGTDCKGN